MIKYPKTPYCKRFECIIDNVQPYCYKCKYFKAIEAEKMLSLSTFGIRIPYFDASRCPYGRRDKKAFPSDNSRAV